DLWRVINADGSLDAHEDHLAHKLMDLLRLNHKQFIEAKLRVVRGEGEGRSDGSDGSDGSRMGWGVTQGERGTGEEKITAGNARNARMEKGEKGKGLEGSDRVDGADAPPCVKGWGKKPRSQRLERSPLAPFQTPPGPNW
ncbi:MAG: TerB family tellurite resistance protein, partial [Candidatus Hydrogenedentes bacterium]|nr:TerB family tellurite resistance protein [Candidatus Hydrogenedentota bacterium]